ncbi:hypothetical protein [Nonlabens ponticola]|uniref:Uncharacterized protein n=1 Tax=Nonlabens ponticola TaxID=2496866 RepID=A0A3S9MYF6_9FLAO|nr:hypothetical protein [Nonlabens ponticola]AZQ44187.1 hypothetical protein EJ995_08055 [Nonlabens ponticola]
MKPLITFFFFVSMAYHGNGQNHTASQILVKADSVLNAHFGKHLIEYFSLDKESRLAKTDSLDVISSPFDRYEVLYDLNHPNFTFENVHLGVYMEFDTSLKFIDMYFDERIPEYLLKNENSNFLTKKQVENIVSKIKLKKAVSPITMRLEWNIHTDKYEWKVFNTLYEEKCYSKDEILLIDAISGEINYHEEEEHRTLHCY